MTTTLPKSRNWLGGYANAIAVLYLNICIVGHKMGVIFIFYISSKRVTDFNNSPLHSGINCESKVLA